MNNVTGIQQIMRNWFIKVPLDKMIPNNVIAICYQIQRTEREFEVFLTGHDDFYRDHDTWLLSKVFEPKANFRGLGINSLELSDQEMYDIYKHEVNEYIKDKIENYPGNVHYFNCRYPVGIPELLFER